MLKVAVSMKKSTFTKQYALLLYALKQARLEAGLTQTEVGRKFGSHASFVSKCESGERRIDVIELTLFCKLYGVSIFDFLKRIPLGQ